MRISTMLAAAMAALLWTAAITEAQDSAPICGDVNDSGSVNTSDALLVLKKGVGQDVNLPCAGYESLDDACQNDLATCDSDFDVCQETLNTTLNDVAICGSDLDLCEETLTATQDDLAKCDADFALAGAAMFATLRFQSTVTAAFPNTEEPPGAAPDDTIIFALSPDLDSAAAPSLKNCSGGDLIGCSETKWQFSPPVPYVVAFSSGHVETGQINSIMIRNGGIEDDGDGSPQIEEDQLVFTGADSSFEVIDTHGSWKIASPPADLFDALSDIGTPELFDLSFFFSADFVTYNYDYATPQKFTIVTNGTSSD